MCRHFCYLGDPVQLSELVLQAPHSLLVQSYAPQHMCGGGRINADGFGVGWYAGDSLAARYRRAGPIWQDSGFAELARHTSATAILGAVRNATAGMPVSDGASAPFTDGSWLFSLNGRIDGWPDSAVPLAEELSTAELLTLDAPTDAALLWAVLRRRLAARDGVAPDPAAVLADLVAGVLAAAPSSRLNLLLTDGTSGYATTVTHSLWVRTSPTGTVLASEPFDGDPAWQRVEDGRLVAADRAGVAIRPLPA
jgi:glutamine amidotransferase